MARLHPAKRKSRVLYKVVDGKTRLSLVAGSLIQQSIDYDRTEYRELLKNLKKYLLIYTKNKVIKAPKHSLGCFLFKRKNDAINFANGFTRTRIIRCTPMARCKKPRTICLVVYSNILDTFYKFHRKLWSRQYEEMKTANIPEGTVCCHKVRVLD